MKIQRFSCKLKEEDIYFVLNVDETAPECSLTRINQVIVHSQDPLKMTVTTLDQECQITSVNQFFEYSLDTCKILVRATNISIAKLECFLAFLDNYNRVESLDVRKTTENGFEHALIDAESYLDLALISPVIERCTYPFTCPQCNKDLDVECTMDGINFFNFNIKEQEFFICKECNQPIQKTHLIRAMLKAFDKCTRALQEQLKIFDSNLVY